MSAPVPAGHTSVMASRRPTPPGALDYFPTPPWAARAGGDLIAQLDPMRGSAWEPACGGGHMAHGLRDDFDRLLESDVFDYGQAERGGRVIDFLSDDALALRGEYDWIISNPPFKSGEAFIRRGWMLARRGVAMLLRLAFLESTARFRLLFGDVPLTVLAPYAERVPMVEGRWDPAASSATAYAWFIFMKGAPGGPPVIRPIPPGAKARWSREEDLRRFGDADAGPLFGGGA